MKKCLMCGAVNAQEVEEGLLLCEECRGIREQHLNNKQEEKVIDVDFTESEKQEQGEEQKIQMKALILCGIGQDNEIIFDTNGTDANLMTLKGLTEYATKRISQMIEQKEYEAIVAMQKAREEAEAVAGAEA